MTKICMLINFFPHLRKHVNSKRVQKDDTEITKENEESFLIGFYYTYAM